MAAIGWVGRLKTKHLSMNVFLFRRTVLKSHQDEFPPY